MEQEELLKGNESEEVMTPIQEEQPLEQETETQPEVTETQPTETQEVDNSPISQYFPNVEITEGNRAELEDAVSKLAEYEGMKAKMDKIIAANRELMAIINDNPMIADILIDLRDGVPADVALRKHVDLEAENPVDGEEPNPAYAEAKKTRMSRLEEKEKRKKMYADNEAKSIEALRQFKEDKKMTDEDYQTFFDSVLKILSAAFDGELSQQLLESIYYALNKDADLDASKQMGIVEGRNEKILNKIQKEDDQVGDGLPALNGGNKPRETETRSEDPFLADIKRLGNKRQIL